MKELSLSGKHANGQSVLVDDEHYDWLMQWSWHLTKKGYARRHTHIAGGKDRTIWMHRAIYARTLLLEDISPLVVVDHKDGNPLNNQMSNLRHGSQALNTLNKRAARKNGSGFKGVRDRKRPGDHRYECYITADGTHLYLGSYSSAQEAAYIYDQFALTLHGQWARLNLLYE